MISSGEQNCDQEQEAKGEHRFDASNVSAKSVANEEIPFLINTCFHYKTQWGFDSEETFAKEIEIKINIDKNGSCSSENFCFNLYQECNHFVYT